MRTKLITMVGIVGFLVSVLQTPSNGQDLPLPFSDTPTFRPAEEPNGFLGGSPNGPRRFDGGDQIVDTEGGAVEVNDEEKIEEEIECNIEYYDIFTGEGRWYDAVKGRAASFALDKAVENWYTHFQDWLDEIECPNNCRRVEKTPPEPTFGEDVEIKEGECNWSIAKDQYGNDKVGEDRYTKDRYGRPEYVCNKTFEAEGSLTCKSLAKLY